MKKTTFAQAFSVLALITLIGSSCSDDNKDTPTPAVKTPQELIVGKWKSNYSGWDSNLNGTWDSAEKVMVPDSDVYYGVFKVDGTFTSYGEGDTTNGMYKFTPDNKAVITKYANEDPDTFIVDQLNETTLIEHSPDGPNHNNYNQYLKVN